MNMKERNNKNNIDSLIKASFIDETQQKRVKKEIVSLKVLNQKFFRISLVNTSIGFKIIIEMTKELLNNVFEEDKITLNRSIIFEIFLDPKFPSTFPKIFCCTKFIKPSLADGRDYTNEIIGKTWNPTVSLSQIVNLLPDFLHKILIETDDNILPKIGSYYLGHIYDIEDFLSLESVACFQAKELMEIKTINPDRYIIITESYFLNFEIQDKKTNIIKLISWANIKQSLIKIKRNKDNLANITFIWKDRSNPNGISQIFCFEDNNAGVKCFDIIMQNMKKHGLKILKNIIKKPDLKIEDVTSKAYDKINIKVLMDHIALFESKIIHELNIDNVNHLMSMYQKAVEYFSAVGDPLYEDYVDRLHYLLCREDIQNILKNKVDSKKNNLQSQQEQQNPYSLKISSSTVDVKKVTSAIDRLKAIHPNQNQNQTNQKELNDSKINTMNIEKKKSIEKIEESKLSKDLIESRSPYVVIENKKSSIVERGTETQSPYSEQIKSERKEKNETLDTILSTPKEEQAVDTIAKNLPKFGINKEVSNVETIEMESKQNENQEDNLDLDNYIEQVSF